MGEKAFEPVAEMFMEPVADMLFCNETDRDSKFVPDRKEKQTSPESHGKETLRQGNLRSTKVRCQKKWQRSSKNNWNGTRLTGIKPGKLLRIYVKESLQQETWSVEAGLEPTETVNQKSLKPIT